MRLYREWSQASLETPHFVFLSLLYVDTIRGEAINTHGTDVTENCGKLTNVNNSHTRNRCHRELRKINECQQFAHTEPMSPRIAEN